MNKITIGICAGLFGGAVFGVMMAVAGMYPLIASLLGMESGLVGFALFRDFRPDRRPFRLRVGRHG